MSIPQALPYESLAQRDPVSFWPVCRFAFIAWSAIVLIRHASYWMASFVRSSPVSTEIRPLAFALIECMFLALILITAIHLRRVTRQHVATLAGCCIGYIAISMAGLALDMFDNYAPTLREPRTWLRASWSISTRAQGWVVPAMALVALARLRGK